MAMNRSLRRSLSDFRRHPWLHVVSISTVTVALLILGGFFLCYRNFETLAEKTNPAVTGTVYLKDGLSEADVKGLRDRISTIPGVHSVTFKSRASVVEELQQFLGGVATESMPGSELFPDVLEIQLRERATSTEVADAKALLGKMSEITEADFSEDWLAQYKKVRQFLKGFGFFLMAAVIIGCSFIIANFMGMRHQSRREEIEIVRLVGAQDGFIFTPFLWEGIIEGVVGAVLALALLYVVKSMLTNLITVQWTTMLGVRGWLFLSFSQVLLVMAIGCAMAIFGSITVFLRFQERAAR